MEFEEKFRATKLWNNVVRSFRFQMPVKRHRRQLRPFDETFTGSEALDWLHDFLSKQPEFNVNGPITRIQALALLSKFYQQSLFFEVGGDKKANSLFRTVRDDNTLYKFCAGSPSKIARTPLALKNERLQRAVSMSQADRTPLRKFKAPITPLKYRKLAVSPGIGRKLLGSLASLDAKSACSPAKRRKVVFDDLAASQETLVPSASQETLVGDENSQTSVATPSDLPQVHLVARHLKPAEIDQIWKRSALDKLKEMLEHDSLEFVQNVQVEGAEIHWNFEHRNKVDIVVLPEGAEGIPRWIFKAMRCLTRWPFENRVGWPTCYPGFERDVFRNLCQYFQNQQPILTSAFTGFLAQTLARLEYLDVQQWDSSLEPPPRFLLTSPLLSNSCASITKALSDVETQSLQGVKLIDEATETEICTELEPEVHFETEFCGSEPITRLLLPPRFGSSTSRRSLNERHSNTSLSQLSQARCRSSYALSSIAEFPFHDFYSERESIVQRIVTPMVKTDKHSFDDSSLGSKSTFSSLPGLVKSPGLQQRVMFSRMNNKRGCEHSREVFLPNVPGCRGSLACPPSAPRSLFQPRQRCSWAAPTPLKRNQNYDDTAYFTPGALLPAVSNPQLSGAITFFSDAARTRAIECVRIALLLLPPKTRHWLQYVVRFMNKTANNNCLKLDPTDATENRYMVLEELCWCVLSAQSKLPLSQAVKLCTFLMDYEPELFKQSSILKEIVDETINDLQRQKVEYSKQSPSELVFCEHITEVEFEQQRSASNQHKAMTELLDALVANQNMDPRKKKRKLKQFKSQYPDIFSAKFPDKSWKQFVRGPSKRSINNPLEKLRNLRL